MKKNQFHIPAGIIYLDGNSLGPMPKATADRVQKTIVDEWGEMLIGGWNKAGWFRQPEVLGDRLAPLVGARSGTVVIGDTLSIKVYQALAAGLKMRPDRNVILTDSGNFPTDLYMAQGLIKTIDKDIKLKVVPPIDVEEHLDEDVAVMMLTQVDYRTGRLHDMEALTKKAHSVGAIALWDLAHSAGALPIDLEACQPEFAVGCTYKYINAGPGAPAFIYTRPDLADTAETALAGWMGHANPFSFNMNYTPATSIQRMRVGTPPVLQMAALAAALDVWENVSLHDVRAQSIELSEKFIVEVEKRCPKLCLASPRDYRQRGSQVSFTSKNGYAIIQALIAEGVIGDFRDPDVMRFGFTPLYLEQNDVLKAVEILEKILENKTWDQDKFKQRGKRNLMNDETGGHHSDGAEVDFSKKMSYLDYLGLDKILSAQNPLSQSHDEMLFIVQHQTSELWMRLALHELYAARTAIKADRFAPAFKMLSRIAKIFEQLNSAWDVLRTMTPSEYTDFRDDLAQSSGFQSHQYRLCEYVIGNRNKAMLKPHAHRPDLIELLENELKQPSLYQEVILALARKGFAISQEVLNRDPAETYAHNASVELAWKQIYENPEDNWKFYELGEKLVDFEDYFRRWRFNHVTTVERIIGFKQGTGGTAGVSYLKQMLEVELFPELWRVRTVL